MDVTMARRIVGSAMLFVASCVGPDVTLLQHEDGEASEERLRRMNLIVEDWDGTAWSAGTERSTGAMDEYIHEHCTQQLSATPAFLSCGGAPSDDCARNYTCPAQLALCQALLARELASAVAPTELNDAAGDPVHRLQPQDAESRAALEQLAQRYARDAILSSSDGLRTPSTCGDARLNEDIGTHEGVVVSGQSTGEVLASTLVEALAVGEAAASSGGRLVIGAADRDRTGMADRGRGARLSWFDRNLSRLMALQLHTGGAMEGGSSGLPAESGGYLQDPYGATYLDLRRTGIGGQPPCEGSCARALTLMRTSGARFDRIVDDAEVLGLPGPGTTLRSLIRNQVSPRLAQRMNRPDIDGMNEEELAAAFNFSPNDFRQARAWMIHEAAVFARPIGYRADIPALMPNPDGSPRLPTPARFDRTTMMEPSQPPTMHYVTAARAEELWQNPDGTGGSESVPPLNRIGRAYLFDLAHTAARRAIGEGRMGNTDAARRTRGVLATIVQDATARNAARVEVCTRLQVAAPIATWRIRVFGEALSDLRLVEGTPGLRCATEGEIEGEPCSLTNATSTAPTAGTLTDRGAGWTDYVEWTFDEPPITPKRPYWYVVRRREDRARGAGGYEAIAGIPWAPPPQGDFQCITLPYDSESEAAASDTFEMTDEMGPSRPCGELDGPLPLEDEIIDDGDRFETSWRHHLQTARRSADRADELGQRLLQSGLRIDEEAQRAADRVVDLCGVSVNLTDLFNADTGATEEFSLDQLTLETPCDDVTAPVCPVDGYTCVGSVCVADRLAPTGGTSFEVEALLSCLGVSERSENVPVVAMGGEDRPLCYWHRTSAPEILCEGSSGNCPYEPDDGAACAVPAGITGQTAALVGDYLDLFDDISPTGGVTGGPSGGGAGVALNCNLLRQARARTRRLDVTDPLLNHIIHSGFFDYENIRLWADRIGWRGYPGDLSDFLLDGEPWVPDATTGLVAGTGYPFAGDASRPPGPATSGWPCNALFRAGSCTSSNALFCQITDCTNATQRVTMNHRMGRAAATLGALSGVGLSQIWMPAHYVDYGFSSGTVEPGWRTVDDYLLGGSGEFGAEGRLSGWILVPTPSNLDTAWTSVSSLGALESHGNGPGASHDILEETPLGFLNFGARYADDDEERARTIARMLWSGLTPTTSPRTVDDLNAALGRSPSSAVAPYVESGSVFYDSLIHAERASDAALLGGRPIRDRIERITHLFSHGPFDAQEGDFSFHTNRAHLFEEPRDNFTQQDLLDAMELACEVSQSIPEHSIEGDCNAGAQPIYTMADVGRVQSQMRCAARRLDAIAARQVVQNIPRDVVSALRGEPSDSRPDIGEYGRTVSRLTQALRARAQVPRQIATELNGAANDIEFLESQSRSFQIERTVSYLQNLSESIAVLVDCASSQFGAACGVAALQLGISLAISELQRDGIDEAQRRAFIEFRNAMQGHVNALATLEEAIDDGADTVEVILSELRQSRQSAQSALARAAFASSDAAGRQYHLNTAMRRLYDIDLIRYNEAHRAAVRHAVVARRAIEQRFGLDLSAQVCGTLVDPPATWADSVCNATGINYAAIRDADAAPPTPDTVRQMFIGDYVSRLEDYVESYRFDNPYTSGDDSMVVSVRNDILQVRGPCAAAAANVLGSSNDLTAAVLPSELGTSVADGLPGWHVPLGGCAERMGGGGELVSYNCVDVDVATPPGATGAIPAGNPRAFTVTFARNSDADPGASDYTDAAAWIQELVLPPGVYQLSWYSPAAASAAAAAVDIRSEEPLEKPTMEGIGGVFTAAGPTEQVLAAPWTRYFRFVRLPAEQVVRVGVFPVTGITPVAPQVFEVAGIQLERVDSTVGTRTWSTLTQAAVDSEPSVFYPVPFIATTAPGYADYSACLTDDPVAFANRWRYDCAVLCSGGFGSETCAEDERPETFCFWQTSFALSEEQLLNRQSGFEGGFAFGNFNYRTGNVAFNVVGTGVRDCSGPGASACFGTATVPVSLVHEPGGVENLSDAYGVRGHDGRVHPVYLFDGHIESARGLAAERYLTSPLSSADRSLLTDYWRTELRGRPLPGIYTLRVWDVPGLDFSRIEDIQIAWEYRYFTRTGERLSCELTGG